MTTIQACVNPRLLTKASRLFTGTLEGRIIELLQNARRAGAKHVAITNHDSTVTVQDDGCGIEDFSKLLDLGGSRWEEELEAAEDPAGVGLFCLAPRAATIRSNGRIVRISGDEGWHGAPLEVLLDPDPVSGTIVRFEDDAWSHATVSPLAVFSGLRVMVDGSPCATEPFVSDQAARLPGLGCRIEVRQAAQLTHWHGQARRSLTYRDNVLVNFHGQATSFDFHPLSEQGLWFLVDLTGEPTGIRLMLPARTQLVENEAFAQLKAALELEAYRYVQRRGHHRLPYREYLRARALGVALPEATPTFQVGLLSMSELPEPVAVEMPQDFPLARCYRIDPDLPDGTDLDETNAHLLAALGNFSEPFVPVSIRSDYDGYAWADLPKIGKVTVTAGPDLHQACVWTGTLRCVETLAIAVHTSDGQVFSSPVCLAKAPPADDTNGWCEDEVLVTREAEERLSPSEIWYHFGGWCDEGDTYDTQLSDFARELDRFWADLVGPDEQLRRSVLEALAGIEPAWKSVQVCASGEIRVQFSDHSAKVIQPPQCDRTPHGQED